jgi:hypothetical protein
LVALYKVVVAVAVQEVALVTKLTQLLAVLELLG